MQPSRTDKLLVATWVVAVIASAIVVTGAGAIFAMAFGGWQP